MWLKKQGPCQNLLTSKVLHYVSRMWSCWRRRASPSSTSQTCGARKRWPTHLPRVATSSSTNSTTSSTTGTHLCRLWVTPGRRLESCLVRWSSFDDSQEQIQRWLKETERRLKEAQPKSDLSEKRALLQKMKVCLFVSFCVNGETWWWLGLRETQCVGHLKDPRMQIYIKMSRWNGYRWNVQLLFMPVTQICSEFTIKWWSRYKFVTDMRCPSIEHLVYSK